LKIDGVGIHSILEHTIFYSKQALALTQDYSPNLYVEVTIT